MYLSRLELRNFRCFESLDLDLDQTTVLVGANDTGKSTVLEAVYWLFGSSRAGVDWSSARTHRGGRGHSERIVSVVGTLADLPEDAQRQLGPTARDGTLRLGRCSLIADPTPWFVMELGAVVALVSELDEERCRDQLGTARPEEIGEALAKQGFIKEIEGALWVDVCSLWELGEGLDAYDRLFAGGFVSAIPLGGPHDAAWSPRAVVEPIVRRAAKDTADIEIVTPGSGRSRLGSLSGIGDAGWSLESAVSNAARALSESLEGAGGVGLGSINVRWEARPQDLDVTGLVLDRLTGVVTRETPSGESPPVPLDALGPGTRRTIALQMLDLYLDLDLWDPRADYQAMPALAVVLLEEPENGLHAAAQRSLAKRLRKWPKYGLQLLLVTHSPAFVDAAPTEGIRLAKKGRDPADDTAVVRNVIRPRDLAEIREELGVKPSDILLASRFVAVEGVSDCLVFDVWAGKLGIDLRAEGIQLIPLHGASKARQITRLLELIYEGADVVAVLDNGRGTANEKLELDQLDRVRTELLGRTELEAYYAPAAIVGWLRLHGAEGVELEEVAAALDGRGGGSKALRRLAKEYLGRDFSKPKDGLSIANLMEEADIPPEIVGLLTRLAE